MNIKMFFEDCLNWIINSVCTENIESFAIAIFGIGVTVFTVLFSFICSKYEVIHELRERISNGVANIEEQAQYKIALRYVSRQREINKYAIFVSTFSFFLFLLCKIKKMFLSENQIFQVFLNVLYIMLILAVGFTMVLVLKDYLRQIRQ